MNLKRKNNKGQPKKNNHDKKRKKVEDLTQDQDLKLEIKLNNNKHRNKSNLVEEISAEDFYSGVNI